MTKNILCFGDSNTYGYVPGEGTRYPDGVRWTSVLADKLGLDYKIFEAGCNNRACFVNHVDGEKFIGRKFIHKYLPYNIDVIVSALGSNDVQKVYKQSVEDLEAGFEEYIEYLKSTFNKSKIIVLIPPVITSSVLNTRFSSLFDSRSVEMSKHLPEIWEKVAYNRGCYYLNLNSVVTVSEKDGLHYDLNSHIMIGYELAKFIETL